MFVYVLLGCFVLDWFGLISVRVLCILGLRCDRFVCVGIASGWLLLVVVCLIVWLWFRCFRLLFCLLRLVGWIIGVGFVFGLLVGCWRFGFVCGWCLLLLGFGLLGVWGV